MSTDRDVSRIVRSWLDEGVTVLPDRVLDAVLDQVPATPQRRATWWRVPRYPTMNKSVAVGLAAVAIVIAAVIGYRMLGPNPSVGPSTPPTTVHPTPSASPAEVVSGPLDPGTYEVPELEGTDIRIRFTVPEGWTWNGFYLGKGAPAADGVVVSFWSGDLHAQII